MNRVIRHRYVCIVFLFLTTAARSSVANPTSNSNSIEEETARSSNTFDELRFVHQLYKECSSDGKELSPCLKVKLLATMDRVSRSTQLDVTEGVTFVQDEVGRAKEEEPKSAEEIEASLPRALDDKEEALNSMIFDKIVAFFQSHTLKLKLPNVQEIQRSFSEEARRKKGKMTGYLAIPLLIGGTLVPLALGALALLAGKALIVSKLALVLASIIGLKKLVSSSHEHGHEVVQVSGHGSSGWARSSHELAYSAYKPPSST